MKVTQEVLIRANRIIPNRAKFAAVLAAEALGLRYMMVRFDPVNACNLKCQMCYFSNPAWTEKHARGRFSADDIQRLADFFFPQTLQLFLGCAMEPTVYKNWPDIIRLARQHGVPFNSMTTNAQLLNPNSIDKVIEYGLDEIVVSAHGVRKETYERLMTNASFDTFHKNLRSLQTAKERAHSRDPKLRINYTVNPDNLEELKDFFQVYGDYDLASLQVRPVIDHGGNYRDNDLSRFLSTYAAIVRGLEDQCRKRGVNLIANFDDPTYSQENPFAVVYEEAVLRYIGPMRVWHEDFDWRTETYAQYKRRTGFRGFLAKRVLDGGKPLVHKTTVATHAVK